MVAEMAEAGADAEDIFAPLASAFSHIQDSAIIYSVEGEVVVWNEGAERLFGYSFDEARRQDVCFLCPPEKSSDTLNLFSRAVSKQPVEPRRVERVHKNGTLISVSTRVTPLEDAGGRVFGVLFLTRDTDPETDQAKRVSELKLRESDIATLVPDALYVHRDGKIVWANAAAVKMFGARSMTDFIGRSPWELIVPEHLDRVQARYAELGPAGVSQPIFVHRRRLDGRAFPTEGRGAAIDWEGEPATLMVVRDLTDQERTVSALAESEARQRGLSDISPDAILVHIDGEIIFVNQAAIEMFGAETADDLIGRQNSTLVHPDDWQEILTSWDADPDSKDLMEVRQLRIDGTEFIGQGRGKPMSWNGKDAFLVVIRDVTEQVAASQALLESETRQRHFAEASPDTMLVHVGGKIVFVNEAAVEMFRAGSAEELIGRPVMETVHPEDRYDIQDNIKAFGEERGAEFIEARRVRFDGTMFLGEGRSRMISWNGEPGMLVVIRDISEHVAAQDALLESEERHRQIVQASPDGVLIHVDGEIVFANESAVEMFRARDEHDLTGRRSDELVPDRLLDEVRQRRQQVQRTGAANTLETTRRRLDGTEFTVEVVGSRYIWHGAPANLTILRDVTERVEAEKSRRAAEERYHQILDLSPNAIFVHCHERLAYLNPAAVRMFGAIDADQLLGRPVMDFLHPDERQKVLDHRPREAAGENVTDISVRRLRLDGSEFVTRANSAAISWGGEPGVLVIARDVTEEHAAEKMLRESEERHRQIVNQNPDAAFIHVNEKIVFANPAAAELLGAESPEALVGRNAMDIVPDDELEATRRRRATLEQDGVALPVKEGRFKRLDGSEFVADATGAAYVWDGAPATLTIMRDVTHRVESERALQESEERHRQIVDLNPDAILVHVKDHILFANPAAVELFGANTEADLIGRSPFDLTPVDSHGIMAERRKQVLAEGFAPLMETRRKRLDGSEFDAEITSSIYTWSGSTAIMTMVRDVSARVDAERKRKALEDRSQKILDLAPQGIFVHGDGKILYANPAAIRLFGGTTPEDLVGRDGLELIHPDDHAQAMQIRENIRNGVDVPLQDMRRFRLDGTEFMSRSANSNIEWDGIEANIVIVEDITERHAAELARRESELRHRTITEASPDGILVYVDFKIVFANRAAADMYQVESPDELLGRPVTDFIPEEERQRFLESFTQLKPGETVQSVVGRRLRDSGEEFHGEAVRSGYIWKGQPATLVVMRDMSERFAAQLQLQDHAEQLERSNKELERFAYVASHDLKEPLRMVSSFCELLKERYADKLDETADQYIDFAVDGAQRMHGLIDDLLQLSRAGTDELEGVAVDLNVVVSNVEHNLLAQIAEAGAELRYHNLPTVHGDPTLLVQLFQNLISNAIKFRTDAPPVVEIAAIEGAEGCTVSVKDNGIGVDPAHHERMFEVFKTLHARGKYDGNGIGLSICRKVVERHGGRLWIESSLGSGTEFFFTLPTADQSAG